MPEPTGTIDPADFVALGTALADLYSQALNGVVCDPGQDEIGRHNCRACSRAWERATAVLAKYDPKWGNGFRGGPSFQPSLAPVVIGTVGTKPSEWGHSYDARVDDLEIVMWAKALIRELHDRDYWPNEAISLADALRRLGELPERVNERLVEMEALKGWAAVGRSGNCIHSKTAKDCAGCQIRVLRELLSRLRQWDVMVCGTGDEPYWRAEIDRVLDVGRIDRKETP